MSPYTPAGETRERVYRYIRERLEQGDPPTVREVQEAFGFRAVETARGHLRRLVDEGKLTQQPGKSRGYGLPRALSPHNQTALVPLLGRIQAGGLAEAIEHPDGHIPVEKRRGSRKLFALTVEGESMTGAGILPGDIVVVRSQSTAQSGDIVVALVEDEATVKTLRFRRGRPVLQPENPDFDPILPPPDRCRILGRVVEVRRTY